MKCLKKKNVFIQLSDGSCTHVFCYNVTKNIFFEYDIRFNLKVFLENLQSFDWNRIKKRKVSLYMF